MRAPNNVKRLMVSLVETTYSWRLRGNQRRSLPESLRICASTASLRRHRRSNSGDAKCTISLAPAAPDCLSGRPNDCWCQKKFLANSICARCSRHV